MEHGKTYALCASSANYLSNTSHKLFDLFPHGYWGCLRCAPEGYSEKSDKHGARGAADQDHALLLADCTHLKAYEQRRVPGGYRSIEVKNPNQLSSMCASRITLSHCALSFRVRSARSVALVTCRSMPWALSFSSRELSDSRLRKAWLSRWTTGTGKPAGP